MNQEKQINTSNLSEGLVINNYIQMCELLEEEVKNGRSKIYQIDEWKRYFDFDKQGNKFIVKIIYDEPIVKVNKKVSNSLYVKFIEILLMAELSNKNGYTAEYTKTNLFHILRMANDNYLPKNRCLVNDKTSELPNWQVYHFYQRSNQKLTEILFSAFNSMKKRCLLDYTEQRKIVSNNIVRVATDDEVEQILEIEKAVLNEMGYYKIPFIKIHEFYEKVNFRLHNEYDWDYAFKDYKLIYNKKFMEKDIQVVKNEISALTKKNRIELNKNIMQAINNQAEYYYQKNCDDYKEAYNKQINNYWGEIWDIDYDDRLRLGGVFNYPRNYIENQNYLANIF